MRNYIREGKRDDGMAERLCIALTCLCLAMPSCQSALHVTDGSVAEVAAAGQADAEACCSAVLRGVFSSAGTMTVPRAGHAATLLGDAGRVLIVGGDDVDNIPLSLRVGSAELYDSGTGTFTATGSLLMARSCPTTTLLGNQRALVAGGSASLTLVGVTTDVQAELYDATTGTFSPTGSLTAGQRVFNTATLLLNGNVLVAGGLAYASLVPPDAHADLYDVGAGTFNATGNMTVTRTQHTGTLLANGKVLIAGGYNANSVNASAELFDPSTGTFASTGSMTVERSSHTATMLADGRVLVTGGSDNSSNALGSAELYDPATGTFMATGSMIAGRFSHSATLLCDGRVLIAGGQDGDSVLASAEIYDPGNGTFSATDALAGSGRNGHTATRLCDGRVLMAGGVDANRSWLATAELYE
jgi:large repetitive protein